MTINDFLCVKGTEWIKEKDVKSISVQIHVQIKFTQQIMLLQYDYAKKLCVSVSSV